MTRLQFNFFPVIIIAFGLVASCTKDKLDPKSTGFNIDTGDVFIPLPNPGFYNEVCIYPFKSIILHLSYPDSFVSYRWLDNNSTDSLHYFNQPTVAEVELTFLNSGTKDTFSIEINRCEPQLYVTNTFSPNGDYLNDTWSPLYFMVEKVHWEIRSEGGLVLFETDDLTATWNGDLPNGKTAPAGLYLYYINYSTLTETNIILTGQIELLR